MDHRERLILACAAIVGIFLLVQLGALAFVELTPDGLQETEDGGDPTLSLALVVAMLGTTVVMLVALRYGGQSVLRAFILLASVYISFFALDVLAPAPFTPTVGGETVPVLALAGAVGIGIALYGYPEWYVLDTAGVVMGVGAAGLFGVNFGILPAVVLLSVLAVYDAISVYGTEHMLTLASGVMEMRVPVVLVVPLSLSYSFLDADPPDAVESDADGTDEPVSGADDGGPVSGDTDGSGVGPNGEQRDLTAAELNALGPDGITELDPGRVAALDSSVLEAVDETTQEAIEEAAPSRDAMFIGLGDAIIPTVLVASVSFYIETGPVVSAFGIPAPLPALTAMVGTLAGLVALLWLVTRGRAHAGLPLLNGGAIAGYLLGALASGLTLAEALGLTGIL
jgi:presenilin-like A22 family membrane protease